MSSRRMNNIKALLERLESLQITKEASSEYEQMETDKMSNAPVSAVAINKNIQAGMPKNIVLDPKWFDSDQTKFED